MRGVIPLLAFTASGVIAAAEQAPLLRNLLLDHPIEQDLPSTSSEALLQLHRKLIETESITENEKDVGEWLASYLGDNGLKVEKQQVSAKRYNILAYPKNRETKVLVSSHIDTVWFTLFFPSLPIDQVPYSSSYD
jgi:acetylornithine deacetylase